jgi:hypothetical protein
MQTKHKRKTVAVSLGILAGVLGFSLLATAGNLDPNGPPGPTMRTLDEVYQAVLRGSSGVAERKGFFRHYEVAEGASETCFTVPAGERFVLLKYWLSSPELELTVDDETFIKGSWFGNADMDFPDRAIAVNSGETLKVANSYISRRFVTIVGYFYDVP